ncbi:hypothetical protein [Bradyrhizobium sp. 1]|uniref:hypothetical protein n=1 Tax=Bradyrhizobium sp. 1 TaxID=241591 RepID=UPI003211A4D2
MAAEAEDDGRFLAGQMIAGTKHIVVTLDLMVDVANAAAWRQGHGVVNRIEPHQGDVADPIANAGIADLGPKQLVPDGIRREEADVAEAGDSGITGGKVALSEPLGAHHKLDPVADRIIEADEFLHLPLRALGGGASVQDVTKGFERCCGGLELALIRDLECSCLVTRITVEIASISAVRQRSRPRLKALARIGSARAFRRSRRCSAA